MPARLAYALDPGEERPALHDDLSPRTQTPGGGQEAAHRDGSADLGPETDLADFTPRYAPWDQRLCLVPDADFFHAVRDKRAKVVTDEIDAFTPTGVSLKSGRTLDADIVVIATGLELNLLGDVAFDVDGERVDFSQRRIYKGCMYEGAPNLASVFGYTNSSWTLKADLIAGYVCRLMNHMRKRGLAVATPGPATGEPALPFMNLTSGYVQRAVDRLPKQGAKPPWRMNQNYAKDVELLRFGRIDDRGADIRQGIEIGIFRCHKYAWHGGPECAQHWRSMMNS